MTELITGAGWVGVLTFCLGIYRITNGRLSRKMEREDCNMHRESIHLEMNSLEKHVDGKVELLDKNNERRIDDLKKFIKNGNSDV